MTLRKTLLLLSTFLLLSLRGPSSDAKLGSQGIGFQGIGFQGIGFQGIGFQGIGFQGIGFQGIGFQGIGFQGIGFQGIGFQGIGFQGIGFQGIGFQGIGFQGIGFQGIGFQGIGFQGIGFQGIGFQGPAFSRQAEVGIDRLRGYLDILHFRGIARSDVLINSDVQGLQSGSSLPVEQVTTNPMAGVQLQAGPNDTGSGPFIFVPAPSGGALNLKGTFWNMLFADSCSSNSDCAAPATCVAGACSSKDGGIALYVADVEKDTQLNASKYPSNDDIYLYTVYYRQPATGQWASLCPTDQFGKAHAMAVPIDPFDHSEAGRSKFTFACTASGVAAKCARNWGYKPWKPLTETLVIDGQRVPDQPVDMAALYDACLVAARADYCQDGQSFTKNGTLVDLFDSLDGGFTSLNASAGLPFTRNAPGPMMHEEYQISTASHVFSPPELASFSDEDRPRFARLLRSGMQSSRYADLDPGRSCLASPYIDRCDPKEPYACYRAANMSSQSYGAFLAVNSPRHCAHDELTDGPALDPLCNECVNRICQLDPSCCGDPGIGFYPGSLVWDRRCSALHDVVCRSGPPDPALPTDHPFNKPWKPGGVAPTAGSQPSRFLSGALGSFEGIVDVGGTRFAEGWACDPDFPGASIPVQLSVGGALGTAGAPLTTVADRPLLPAWRQAAAAACGGEGRHGFSIAVPVGQEIFAYGIDLNVPGAPFTLLRGGRKTVPGPTLDQPRGAVWTGWLEPAASGNYVFCKQLSTGVCTPQPGPVNPSDADRYRIWVNGSYVAGNWIDDPGPGAFTLAPPDPFSLYLQEGVRYGVRIEFQRPSTTFSSDFALLWSQDGGAFQPIQPNLFHPVAQGSGNGLLGTYYASTDRSGSPAGQSVAAVDKVWTVDSLPAPGIVISNGFSATFEGQVVPPISGDYTFTAETDGPVRIFVNGQLATDATRRPPAAGNPDLCPHDICETGAAISRTCNQGYYCSAQICLRDPACCSITWDRQCVEQVARICKLDCTPTPPVQVTLRAGVKYDIRVEYAHNAGTGASLRLMWALPGGPRDVIPVERLFAGRDVTSPAGVGLNAAYFFDADFKNEYLDHVEPAPLFGDGFQPGVLRMQSLICAAPCTDAGDVLGPPALTEPVPGGRVSGPNVTVKGIGASAGATVSFFKDGAPIGTAATASAAGVFSVTLDLADGTHTITADQQIGGKRSVASAPLAIVVGSPIHPDAPPVPSVDQPQGGLVSANGQLAIGGTGTSGATVTVKVGDTTVGTFQVVDGHWGGFVTLGDPGSYTLSVTQTSGGHTSATGPDLTARVTLPPLIVTTPVDGPVDSQMVAISGNAPGNLGPVLVGDGDGRVFAERASLPVTSGAFTGSLTLDYGRHVLKFFQRTRGLDGDGVLRTVSVRPPRDTLAITSVVTPTEGVVPIAPTPTIDGQVAVKGGGGLRRTGAGGTALRGSVIVYQGTTRVGEGPLADDGGFEVAVTLIGAGDQTLSVSQVAHSLSGGGAAESDRTAPVMIKVRPSKPVITTPKTGTKQTPLDVAVAGTALPGADVTIAVDGTERTTVRAEATDPLQPAIGLFATSLSLAVGSHRLTAYQRVDLTRGEDSDAVLVAVGDVTPPTLEVVRAACASLRDSNPTHECPAVRELVLPEAGDPAADDTGAIVDLSAKVRISASDAGSSLPVTCIPSATVASRFPLGSSNVTCAATDAANNRSATTFVVTVRSGAAPVIADGSVTVEALGPDGAVVNYPLAATGWVADCAPPGATEVVPCTTWKVANKGLGFTPTAVAVNGNDGTVYTGFPDSDPSFTQLGSLLTSVDHGATWTKAASPSATMTFSQILWVGGTRPALYIPTSVVGTAPSFLNGVRISRDGGSSWTSALPGVQIRGVAVDPRDPDHLFAWTQPNGPTPSTQSVLFETRDGWTTWSNAGQGLPTGLDSEGHGLAGTLIAAMAIDPIDPTRMYVAIPPETDEDGFSEEEVDARIFRKLGSGSWEQVGIPPQAPNRLFISNFNGLAVAPWLTPCIDGDDPCPTHPTVFAGHLMSTDGGERWNPIPIPTGGTSNTLAFLFDRTTPGTIYASNSAGGVVRSQDYGRSWVVRNDNMLMLSFAQDAQQPETLYGISFFGMLKSVDAGATWTPVEAPDQSLAVTYAEDLVVDPGNADIAYLLTAAGIYKTTNGGESWLPASTGLGFMTALFLDRMEIDPFDRQTIYASGSGGTFKSLDGAGPKGWTQLDGRYGVMKVDPRSRDTMYVTFQGNISDGYLSNMRRWVGDEEIELRQSGWSSDFVVRPFALQVVPDAARTVIMSYLTSSESYYGITTEEAGDVMFSTVQAQRGSGFDGAPVVGLPGGYATLLYDGSDGTDSLFVSGAALEKDASLLYRARLGAPTMDWQLVGGRPVGGDGVPFSDFARLLIDPATAGRTMYALGASDSLWQSHDAGQTWQPDERAPSFMRNLWLSPVDGALYAAVQPYPTTAEQRRRLRTDASSAEGFGTIWKRTLTAGTPPGARVVQGDVRVICTSGGRILPPGSRFPLDVTTLSCTATDAFGNTATRTITITVRDSTPPKITVPTQLGVNGAGPATVDYGDSVSATDNIDGPLTPTCDHPSGSDFETGTTTVLCSATDAAGNTGRASFPVVVSEVFWPDVTVPADITVDAIGQGAVVTYTASARRAFGGAITPICVPPSGSTFPVGVTVVTCTATDAGVTVPRSFNVTVRDVTPPVIHVPAPQPVSAAGAHGARFDYTVTADDAVEGPVAATCTPESGSTFPLGTTTVVCRAADSIGNRATAQFDVTVADHNSPKLQLADITAEAQDQTGARVPFTASATDAEDGVIVPDCLPPAGGWFPMDDTTVVCTARDIAGNETRGSFVVHVVDRTAPAISVPASLVVEADSPDGAVVRFDASAGDAVDGTATRAPSCMRVSGLGLPTPVASGAIFPLGDSTVTCSATDAAGNIGSATFTVLVRDTTPPLLHLPDAVTANADASGTALVSFPVTADDIVAGALPVGCTPRPGSRFLPGPTIVTCSARDGAGNEARGSFTVTVGIGDTRGQPCLGNSQCGDLLCVDGVCCEDACGGGLENDCRACSVAAGGSVNGTCTAVRAGHVCRAGAGACDLAETCDGTAVACPADAFAPTTQTCRQSAGLCDLAETCTGTTAACPADAFAPTTQTCRQSAGLCDLAETCTGTTTACPADAFAPTTQTCRQSAGLCDLAETCTGITAACPADAFAPTTQTCRQSAGLCDLAETCTGITAACPADAFAPTTQTCRQSAGLCDLAETCTGTTAACPADAFAPATQTCRPSAGLCDLAETCTGTTAACPADALAPATQTCRPSAGLCDLAETCTGAAVSCPPDRFAGDGTICAPAGPCQSPGACDGVGAACPGPTPIPGCNTDTTPPVWSNVPGTIVAYATSTAGATVTYTKPTATDAVDGVRPVTCTPAPGSMFPINTKPVTCTASDTKGNSTSVTFKVWVQYQAPTDGTFFLFPIKSDGSSVFRIGRPVPVRFKLQGVSKDITNVVAKLVVTKISNQVLGTTVVTSDETIDDNDFTFKYRPLLKWYIYRWKTRDQTKGTYLLKADLGDGVTHQVNVSLTTP